MKRRHFIKSTSQAAVLASTVPVLGMPSAKNKDQDANRHDFLPMFIEKNDLLIDEILIRQQNDGSKPFFGGFPGTYAIFPIGRAAWYINRMMCGFVTKESRHFKSDAVFTSMTNAMTFARDLQHEDGTIDLTSTNFHSTPDTGFVVEPIALAYQILRNSNVGEDSEFSQLAKSFLQSAGKALTVGGIHTPNHRWVVSMALARINQLFPERRLVERAEQWLAEDIDIDSEGHYTEHSTSIYSPLINRCLITIARLLDKPDLLDPVRKNLSLNKYLFRPNGEVVTAASRRQDQFKIAKMGNHYYSYRYMALHDNDEQFTAMARMIEKTVGQPNLYGNLTYFLEDETLQKPMGRVGKLPIRYTRTFPKSKIVRIRRDQFDATILADSETFLSVHRGNAALRAVRFASAFFGKGQFKSTSIKEPVPGEFVLQQSLRGPYYQPLPIELLPGDGDWNKMPRERRPQSEIQQLTSTVTVSNLDGKLKIVFQIDGTERVPLAIELAFDRLGVLNGVSPVEGFADTFLINDDNFSFTSANSTINFSGARSKHRWTQIRGALPKLDAQCVYITDFTPFQFELTIS